jgi:hypothetical protein
MTAKGFWSYVHKDDSSDGGRIVRLAHDIVDQFEMITGEHIELFLDRDTITWGSNWRNVIYSNLESVAFFIPVLSPRYFQSQQCRRELQLFGRKAKELGVSDLIMPLLYVDIPSIHAEDPEDDAIALVQKFQWVDWMELRFSDPMSSDYRRKVFELAKRIAQINESLQASAATAVAESVEHASTVGDDGEINYTEELSKMDSHISIWANVSTQIREEIDAITAVMSDSVASFAETDSKPGSISKLEAIADELRLKLQSRVGRIVTLANEYTSLLYPVDADVRSMIADAPLRISNGTATADQVCEYFSSLRYLAQAAHTLLDSIQGFGSTFDESKIPSRILRMSLRRYRQGLTLYSEGLILIDEWVGLIDASQVVCN